MDLVEQRCDVCHRHVLRLWNCKVLPGKKVCRKCYFKVYMKARRDKEVKQSEAQPQSSSLPLPPVAPNEVGGVA